VTAVGSKEFTCDIVLDMHYALQCAVTLLTFCCHTLPTFQIVHVCMYATARVLMLFIISSVFFSVIVQLLPVTVPKQCLWFSSLSALYFYVCL